MRLIADRLSCRRGERTLFRDLSLALDVGDALCVTGPNGAGKTSLLRILAGLLRPSAGAVRITPSDGNISIPEQITFVGVRGGLKNGLSVAEQLDFWRRMAGDPTGARSSGGPRDAMLDWSLSALAELPVAWLSSGQRRRLELARLSCEARPIWLLDEPLNALDAAAADLLHDAVQRFRSEGGIVVAASHQPLGWTDLTHLTIDPRQIASQAPAA